MSDFSYILDKIRQTEMKAAPFTHLEIDGLFEPKHFQEVIRSPEIMVPSAANDKELFSVLSARGYKIIKFPGCTTDQKEYENWHREKRVSHRTRTTCEGFGVVLRLYQAQSDAISQLKEFLDSETFIDCIATKFGLAAEDCTYDAGIQKYLDGYEISPHPDIRRKALTYMVNVNPGRDSESQEHHTSYLTFKSQWSYVQEFWRTNPKFDRDWVPWDWCDIQTQQRRNNSLVIFQPSHNTLHAVRASYNHFDGQRTQLYGNLWFNDAPKLESVRWDDLVIRPRQFSLKKSLKSYVPASIQNVLRASKRSGADTGKRRVP